MIDAEAGAAIAADDDDDEEEEEEEDDDDDDDDDDEAAEEEEEDAEVVGWGWVAVLSWLPSVMLSSASCCMCCGACWLTKKTSTAPWVLDKLSM
jgi:hypothetical protein